MNELRRFAEVGGFNFRKMSAAEVRKPQNIVELQCPSEVAEYGSQPPRGQPPSLPQVSENATHLCVGQFAEPSPNNPLTIPRGRDRRLGAPSLPDRKKEIRHDIPTDAPNRRESESAWH